MATETETFVATFETEAEETFIVGYAETFIPETETETEIASAVRT